MKKGLAKCFSFVSLICIFLFSGFSLVWADVVHDFQSPYDYVFCLVLRSLRLITHATSSPQWSDAYEGYLQSINDISMLNQLQEYKNLSWGDTIPDVYPLFDSLYHWVSLSDDYVAKYVTGTSSPNSYPYFQFLTLPSKSAPLPSSIGMEGVQAMPFFDVDIPSDVEGYVYLYSDSYLDIDENGRKICVRRNIYAPDGVEVISSYISGSPDFIRLPIRRVTGVWSLESVELKSISTVYFMDSLSVKQKDNSFSESFSEVCYRLPFVMNLPFYVFSNSDDAGRYSSNGLVVRACTNNSAALWTFNPDRRTFSWNIDSLYAGELTLPSSAAEAASLFDSFFPGTFDSSSLFTSALKNGGLDIADKGSYILEIYKEDTEGNFIKEETEKLPGGIGRVPYISKTYPNFSLQEELTTPKNGVVLEDGSLTVKAYYARDRIDYTVEHYQQNKDGTGWIKEEAENLSGLFGSEASFTAKNYPGFTFVEGLTEPDNLIISADNELTIKLYYLRDLISYTVEHYQQDVADESGKQDWTLVDQDLLSGLFETEAVFTPKNYSGFTFAEQLTEPDNYILPADDRTLTIKLYYTRNPVQYIIEHYTQNLIKQNESSGWTLADREVLSGVAGMLADCPKKSYAGLRYNSSLTEPADRRIRSDGSLVIRMYYVQNLFGDFKEPFETVTKKMIVLSAAVLPFTFIVLFLIRLFKQILSKA